VGNTAMLGYDDYEPQTVSYTELYPKDDFGMREVPIVHKDVYGRVSRVVMTKVNEHQYNEWRKENGV
jgi:hypothetical protein